MNRWIGLTGLLLTLCTFARPATGQDRPISLGGGALSVELDSATGAFTMKSGDVRFVTAGKLEQGGGDAKLVDVQGPLGKGRAIEIRHASGALTRIAIYDGCSLAIFQTQVHNSAAQDETIRKVTPVTFSAKLAKPAAGIRILSSGGLTEAAKDAGSFSFLAAADPDTRTGLVVGWLTHLRGNGVVFSHPAGEEIKIEARSEYGKLLLKPGQAVEGEPLAIGYFPDVRLGLESYADAIAKVLDIHLNPIVSGYSTWYHSPGGAGNEAQIAKIAEFARARLVPFGFNFIQLDDGWQAGAKLNGPRKNFTTHDPRGSYPNGVKSTADKIRQAGMTPGIWWMPFAGTAADAHFKDHQDWFVKGPDGKVFETKWGENCLDLTNPQVQKYVEDIARRASGEWGYKLFKLDGLWTGTGTKIMYVEDDYKDDSMGETTFADPSMTNMQAYREGLRLVRQGAGKDVFLLGCCMSQNMRTLGGSFGLVDAMRVGPDNGAKWDRYLRGPEFGSRYFFLHGRVWYNDGDCIYVRPSCTLDQARAGVSWVSLTGYMNLVSEMLPQLPDERVYILQRSLPNHGLKARPVDLLDQPIPQVWQLTDTRYGLRRDVIGVFNWSTDKPLKLSIPLSRLDLPGNGAGAYVGFDYWNDKFMPAVQGQLSPELPPSSCRIIALRQSADRPQVISTSRHITQGIVDIDSEQWDDAASTLSGASVVVAGDPYELRLAAGDGWTASAAELSADDKSAGATAKLQQDGPCVRVTIASPVSRKVQWKVAFTKAGR